MNAERLLDVVTVLEDVPDQQFDMDSWSCDTAACAVGWYCTKRPDSELRLKDEGDGCPYPATTHHVGWLAVKQHFSISVREAEYLFDPLKYAPGVPRANVIARIREFVASDGKAVPHEH